VFDCAGRFATLLNIVINPSFALAEQRYERAGMRLQQTLLTVSR
jgi:hypothetical protein